MGQLLMSFVDGMKATDERTFEMQLKEPYGLVLLSLAKPSSNVPFIMPKRIAETPSSEQISEYVGSGPFVFERDEWEPGNKAVFTKFEGYKPRSEPPSWAAGGKVAKVDRVEWVWIPDMQTAVNALINGEIDVIESPAHDLLPILEADDSIALFDYNPLGNQYMFRMNWLHPPFDNQKVRQAALAALNQEDFLKAVIGDPRYYKTCPAMFICDTPFATDAGRRGPADLGLRALQAAARGGRLRRHAGHADALDRPAGAGQPRAGRQAAPGAGRLHRRHAVDGLADAGLAPGQEGAAGGRRLERAADLVGRGRRAQPDQHRRPERVVRGRVVRLAVRRAARAAARSRSRPRPIRPGRPSSRTRSRRARSRSAPTPMSASGISRSRIATTCRACCTARRRSSGTSARASER